MGHESHVSRPRGACMSQQSNPSLGQIIVRWFMMTSSNGNISHVTGICAGNSPVPGEFPAQRPVTRSFDVFFDLRLNKRLRKQSWGWWFETLARPLWRHCNVDGHLLEAARFGFRLFRSLSNMTGTSAAALPWCLLNFRAMRPLQHPISRLRDFTTSHPSV